MLMLHFLKLIEWARSWLAATIRMQIRGGKGFIMRSFAILVMQMESMG